MFALKKLLTLKIISIEKLLLATRLFFKKRSLGDLMGIRLF
jgi:hypothetical protein